MCIEALMVVYALEQLLEHPVHADQIPLQVGNILFTRISFTSVPNNNIVSQFGLYTGETRWYLFKFTTF